MRFSTVCVFSFVFILNNSMATPLGLARVFNSKAGTSKSSSSSEEIPQVVIEISTVSIPSVTTPPSEATTTEIPFETTTPIEITESTEANIIDSSTEVVISVNETIISTTSNVTMETKNDTSLARSKRSCRGFECEQMQQLPPSPAQSPPCFGPRCGGYGCGCGFSCTIKFRPCCQRCQPQPLPPPPPPAPACNNNGCVLPPPSGCRYPQPPAPAACPCPQQPEERPVPAACECQPGCNSVPAPPPPPPPPPPRCGCTPRGCGCSRPPLMPSPINIHINGMGGMGGMNGMGGDMDFPPPMPYRNPCASCSCPAPVCRCPPACTKQCGPAGCTNNNNVRSPQTPYPRFPDYDYPQNSPRDNDYFDYNSYRHRRSLFNNVGRFPYSKS